MKQQFANLGNFAEGMSVPRCAYARALASKYLFGARTVGGGGGGPPRAPLLCMRA